MADTAPWPTPLAQALAGQGPMPFRDFMAEALYAPKHGFYTRRDLPRRRDDPTEDPIYLSGVARQLAQGFSRFAATYEPRLVQQGAGTGKLMRFLLAALAPPMREAMELVFIEPRLARRTRLVAVLEEFGVQGSVVASPTSLSPGPTFVVARELLGAFPVHWVEASEDGWREVDVTFESDRWAWREQLDDVPQGVAAFLEAHVEGQPAGHRYEVNLQMVGWLGDLAAAMDPGVLAVLDRARPPQAPAEGTVRGVLDGQRVAPYEAPGRTELSAAVDLAALAAEAGKHGLIEREPVPGLVEASRPHLTPLTLTTPGV